MQMRLEDISKRLKEYVRILKLAKRPKREEFFKISKIAGAAMALIGIIGFSIYLLMSVLPKAV
ncbi:protein translocase SEC61 complex subunit gamma [Methanophagales archaeon]|nr:protein translocase SEC61 complex subunit gamma [Methanophagales archaeon]RJS74242.1 MAG: protein translocase SEC61 complex subunit gamma [Methanophagales archaeon]RJS82170.1 MAG: protein translocase SEC61 complex subunit gamma [Methanophagales archaeon]